MKDHEIREMVNDLTAAAQVYGATQQLREQIVKVVHTHLTKENTDDEEMHRDWCCGGHDIDPHCVCDDCPRD